MKITGYQLREALKVWDIRKEAATQAFPDSLFKFQDETKEAPTAIAAQIKTTEEAIARLQVAQMRYNLLVRVSVRDYGDITLAEAIKFAGVADRAEKLWKGTKPSKRSYYETETVRVRDSGREHAQPTLDAKGMLQSVSQASRVVSNFRVALAKGNAVEVEIENLDPLLFE